jgi:hypothetical protein
MDSFNPRSKKRYVLGRLFPGNCDKQDSGKHTCLQGFGLKNVTYTICKVKERKPSHIDLDSWK